MSMTVNQETNQGNKCEHCGRTFMRESNFIRHICEPKRRWLDKDKLGNRIGYNSWKAYYNKHHPGKKSTAYQDFIKSSYYLAFVKFGNYCADITAVNPGAYAAWLVKNNIPIDTWATDKNYNRYIVEYIRDEDPMDAVKRTMETLLDISTASNIQLQDTLRYGNQNRLCHLITAGKISPWVLYHSKSGLEFLGKLDQGQTDLIFEYIDPQKWSIKFKRYGESLQEVKAVLGEVQL